MRRAVVTLGVVGLFAACGFPDVTYKSASGGDGGADGKSNVDAPVGAEGSGGDDGEAGTGDGATSEASADASGDTGDSSTIADTGADGPATDADAKADAPGDSSTGDSSTDAIEEQVVDSAADALDCDQDHDGYRSMGVGCNGNDCCDTDANAHPGVTAFFTAPDACGNYDYDCSGTIVAEYTVNVTCTGNSVTGCSTGAGFTGDPACGASGTYQTACVLNGLLKCAASDDPTPPTQACN